MRNEVVEVLNTKIESYSKRNENGAEFWLARDLQFLLGYSEWRNFEGVIKRAVNIIIHGYSDGSIVRIESKTLIGSGAYRQITDYCINESAVALIKELCSSQKLNNVYKHRNETIVLQLLEKYCKEKFIDFDFQYCLGRFRFDCKVGNNILVEFDEPHHSYNTKQKVVDKEKENIATINGFKLFRVNLDMDIVDIILYVDAHVL